MGTQLPSLKWGGAPPTKFSAHLYCGQIKGMNASRCHLIRRWASANARLCSMWTQLPPEKGHTHLTKFLAHVYYGQMAGWMKTPLGSWYGSRPRPRPHSTRRGPAPAKGAQQPPLFGPCLLWPRSPISATAELLFQFFKPQNLGF